MNKLKIGIDLKTEYESVCILVKHIGRVTHWKKTTNDNYIN